MKKNDNLVISSPASVNPTIWTETEGIKIERWNKLNKFPLPNKDELESSGFHWRDSISFAAAETWQVKSLGRSGSLTMKVMWNAVSNSKKWIICTQFL